MALGTLTRASQGGGRASFEHGPPRGVEQGVGHNVAMSDARVTPPTYYRLAPAVAARLVGLALLVLVLATFALTVLVVRTSISPDLIVVLLVLGLLGVVGAGTWLRTKAYVVRLDDEGYSVRLVRGAGVKDGRWSEVTEAVAGQPKDVPCVILRRTDGGTTSIPVGLLGVDRDDFAREVGGYLLRAYRDRA